MQPEKALVVWENPAPLWSSSSERPVVKDRSAATLHDKVVPLRFELIGRPGRPHPPTSPPGSQEPTS
jgi:hypothetical protein